MSKRYKDVLGRLWRYGDTVYWMEGDGWDSDGQHPRETIERLTGGPLVEVEPEPVVWEATGSTSRLRARNCKVQEPWRGEWVELDAIVVTKARLVAALAEGREPDPSVARRVTE